MELTERQETILEAILNEHIKTAHAVGSNVLVEKYGVDLSSASIRHEMAELEDRGLLMQPHTSAGRVPTVLAYRYYLEHFLKEGEVPKREQETIQKAIQSAEGPDEPFKAVAKALAEICSNTVIVGFARHDVYYTGITNLFHQPEFEERVTMLNISAIVDHLDDVIESLFDDVTDEPQILLGRENPFGETTGVLLTKWKPQRAERLFGILGPVRMPYGRHLALLRYTKNLLHASL